MDLFERVSEDIKNAMKAKDKVALETLRNVKKVFLEAKTAPGANDTLSDADALKIIQKLTKQGKDAAEIYVQQGRQDLADDELAQVKVLETYLPKQMSAEEQQRLAELEEEEEQRRNRREVYYGKDANARSQRSRRRHIYLFNPEDMDNADIISMVENSPTYLRDKSTLNSIKMKAEQEGQLATEAAQEAEGGAGGVITF